MTKWPADTIERRPIESLVPYEKNARTHSDAQIAQIAASMKEWGWTNPVLVDEEGVVIAGHGRLLAAQSLGIDEAPVMVAKDWTEAQKRAYTLADNQLAMNAGWDDDLLKTELSELKEWKFDLPLIGFDNLDKIFDEQDDDDEGVENHHDDKRFLLQIEFQDEQSLATMFEECRERGLIVRVLE